jgi:hypothetical protein
MSISAARMRVNMSKENLESGRLDLVEGTLAEAVRYLQSLTEAEAAPVHAEIAEVRAKLASMPTAEETRFVGAALRDIKAARSKIAERELSIVDAIIKRAANYVVNVRAEHRAKVDAEIAAVTAELHAASAPPATVSNTVASSPTTAPTAPNASSASSPTPASNASNTTASSSVPASNTASSAPTATAERRPLTDAEYSEQSRIRGLIRSVFNRVESRRTDGALEELASIEPQLAALPEFAAEPMRAQIAEIRAMYRQHVGAEAARVVNSELDRRLRSAEGSIETMAWARTRDDLAHVEKRLADDDAKDVLSPDEVGTYRTRIADIRAQLAAFIKQDAIGRTADVLAELERDVASEPFVGLDDMAVYRRKNDLDRLRSRVLAGIRPADERDVDIAAIAKRVDIAEQAIDTQLLAWSKAKLDAEVSNDWIVIEKDIAGWQDEQDTNTHADGLYEPALPKTRSAIQRTRWLLDAPETKERRAAHPDDPAIQGPFQIAERTFADAGAKLAEAYSRVLAHGESLETPLSHFTLVRPGLLALSAESDLAGTPFREAVTGRARALDERWKIEVAAIYKARQELYDKLDGEAEVAWPAMRDAMDAVPFDPASARPGMLVRLDQVYNRCGWDYGSRAYSFAVRAGGVVLGGSYEPHVLAALEHAWYQLKLSVNDRIVWDVIGVVEGPDKIGVRTTVTLRDKSSGEKLGEIEEWPPIDCIRIRIVALRAGPVAVTPQSPWAPIA